MKLSGVQTTYVDINYTGSYSDLIDSIFMDIFKISIKAIDNINITTDQIEFRIDEAVHGSPLYKTLKIIKKSDNEELFNLANNLYLIYIDLLKINRINESQN